MYNITNVVVNGNVILCNVDGNAYSLEFDMSDTLCVVLINNEEVIDYCEDLIEAIIDMSFELS
tara:strand:- start:2469 stop:2657 length:189 start_codon:yes stop_codon:yes gene_type:complete